ncbi:MAG: hypothetical protein ACI9KE_006511, partial [Polyangiales bacterium]
LHFGRRTEALEEEFEAWGGFEVTLIIVENGELAVGMS